MKCQHCGSNDIVAIQGQNYCLNCGYAVAATVETPAVAPMASKAKSKQRSRSKVARPASKAVATAQTAPAAAKTVAQRPEADIVPSTPARRAQAPRPNSQPVSRTRVPAAIHPLRFSLLVASIAAVLTGIITVAVLWFQLDTDTGAYAIIATLVSLGVGVGLAHSALLYGRSRNQDGRPAPRAYWWLAARSGFMDVVNVQLIAVICALLLVGIGVVVWRAVTASSLHLGVVVTAPVLGVVNAVLIWALLGVYAAARLAAPAVVIGGYSATEAVKVGWQLYLKAGGHVIAGAIEALLSRTITAVALAVAGYAAARTISISGTGAVAVGSGIAATLIVFAVVMLSLEVDTKLWLGQYRHWVTLRPPAERIRLLTGRVQSHL